MSLLIGRVVPEHAPNCSDDRTRLQNMSSEWIEIWFLQGITHLEQLPSDSTAKAHGCRTQGGAAPWPRTTRLLAHYRKEKGRSLRSAAI